MWKGAEHQAVGYEGSVVPPPTPTFNAPKDRSVVAAVQRAPSPAVDVMQEGTGNQNTPRRLRRGGDTNEEPRSPIPTSGRGAMWKGREHEAIQGRTELKPRDENEPAPGAMWKNEVHQQSINEKRRGIGRRSDNRPATGAMWKNRVHEETS